VGWDAPHYCALQVAAAQGKTYVSGNCHAGACSLWLPTFRTAAHELPCIDRQAHPYTSLC